MSGEGPGKVALTGKTGHECYLAQGEIGLFEEALCGLKAPVDDILMGTFAGHLPKEARKMKRAESALLGEFG